MATMKRTWILALIVISVNVSIAGSGGSAYSIFGLGDLRYMTSTRGIAMGYTGIGLHSTNHINSMAPATWSRINHTRLDAGMLYEGFNSSNGTRSLYRANGDFSGALLAIPVSPTYGVVFVGGFTPYSNVSYNTFTSGTQAGIDYTLNHVGSGGLGKGLIGLSYAPTQDIAFGASLDYLFGTVEHSRRLTATSTTSTPAVGGITNESTTLHGITTTLSTLFTGFGKVSESLQPLSIGVVVTSRGNLKSTRQLYYQYTAERDSSDETSGRVSVPVALGIGLAYQSGERYLFAADYFTQGWKNSDLNGLRNSFRLGVGAERIGNRDPQAQWLDRVAYRLGFAYHGTYYRVNNEPINEWTITGGVGIPFGFDGRINLAMEYGQRGLTGNNLIKDTIVRFTFGLSLSEQWFVRYEED